MEDIRAIRGDLQREIMRILWSHDSPTVEEVRQSLPVQRRGAYTTVQTVLNRLADRGLVTRHRDGKAIRYKAKISEADYVSSSLNRALADASEQARRSALANLVEELDPRDLDAMQALAEQIRRRRS